jgi:hypothetical protein
MFNSEKGNGLITVIIIIAIAVILFFIFKGNKNEENVDVVDEQPIAEEVVADEQADPAVPTEDPASEVAPDPEGEEGEMVTEEEEAPAEEALEEEAPAEEEVPAEEETPVEEEA